MAEQNDLAALFGAEPPRHGLRRRIFAIDAMDDFIDLEGRKRPIDHRPGRLDGVTLAAKFAGDPPTDFKPRPVLRTPWPDPPGEFARGFFLDHEHADAIQHPMPRHDRR